MAAFNRLVYGPVVLLLIATGYATSATTPCPCSDESLCQPLQVGPRLEKVAFMIFTNNWRSYDFAQLTTIVIFTGDFEPQLLCLAHSQQVRLVWGADYDVKQLGNATARTEWVRTQVDKVKATFTDGINIDMEDEIAAGSEAVQQYTALVQELTDLLRAQVLGAKVSVDVPYTAPCEMGCCFDYAGLARASDFLFIMGYSIRSHIYNQSNCVASANAPISSITAGVANYTQIYGIAPSKLVLGVPWYCYDYKCLSLDINFTCALKNVPFRGYPCSVSAVGNDHDYHVCRELLRVNSTTGRHVDNRTGSVFFNYFNLNDGYMHQVWMDDPETLSIKYELARDKRLLGIGMWNADCLDYATNASKVVQQDTKDMWDAMHRFH